MVVYGSAQTAYDLNLGPILPFRLDIFSFGPTITLSFVLTLHRQPSNSRKHIVMVNVLK